MDDFLIIVSYLMIFPLIFIAWPWLKTFGDFESLGPFFNSAPERLGARLSAIILYGSGAVSSQIVGRIIRFKEKQSLEILDTLQFYKKTTIPQLSSQLGMAESRISALVKKMSRISSLGINIDGEIVSIGQIEAKPEYDGYDAYDAPAEPKIVDEQPATEDSPLKTFASFGEEFKAAVEKANSDSSLSEEQKREQVKKAAQNIFSTRVSRNSSGKKFNFVLFIILFITPLWPVALIYAISFAVKQQKGKE